MDSATRPVWVASPLTDRFLVEKTLFETFVVDRKIGPRIAALKCPECGRRGYCLRLCRRSHLRGGASVNELDLRWRYVAQIIFSRSHELAELGRFVRIPDKEATV